MKLQIFINDVDRGTVDLAGPGIIPYAQAISGFSQFLASVYAEENPDSPDYLTISGAEVSLKSRVRTPRRRRA